MMKKNRWKSLDSMNKVQNNNKFPRMRAAICDYLGYFHTVFKLKDDHTLFKAMQIFDQYINQVKVPKSELQ